MVRSSNCAVLSFAILGVAVSLLGCGGQQRVPAYGSARTIRAAAPPGVVVLGAPYDSEFRPLRQTPLFRKGKRPHEQSLNEMRHEYVFIESSEELRANAAAWSTPSTGGGFDLSQRWAAYRAYQLVSVAELDDSTRMREPPPSAVYYPWRVYVGRAYEVVMGGSARDFNQGVREELLGFGGSIERFARKQGLQTYSIARGLQPARGEAVFARTPDEIQSGYVADGEPVPIIVEYRRIPGTAFDESRISWESPLQVVVRFTSLTVHKGGSWGATPWRLVASCRVNHRDVPVANPTVWEGKVRAHQTYPSSWSATYAVLRGDTLSCGTQGTLEDVMTSRQSAGDGAMEPVTIEAGLRVRGSYPAKNAKASYTVSWTIEVSNPPPRP